MNIYNVTLVSAIICIGVLGFMVLKYAIEPWVIDTLCRELIECNRT